MACSKGVQAGPAGKASAAALVFSAARAFGVESDRGFGSMSEMATASISAPLVRGERPAEDGRVTPGLGESLDPIHCRVRRHVP